MPTCRIFTNMHCRPIFYIFANADRLRAVLLSPALSPILPSWSMQMNDERNERINSSASIFLASLPPRSMVRYCIDSCGNDVSTVMEFSRSHSQSPDASCQQMVKACGMHNIIIGCRILHRHGRWPIVAANPLKWSEKSVPSHWPDKFAKAWWLSCTIVFVEVEDCRVQWCFRWLLLCGIQVLSSISWAN